MEAEAATAAKSGLSRSRDQRGTNYGRYGERGQFLVNHGCPPIGHIAPSGTRVRLGRRECVPRLSYISDLELSCPKVQLLPSNPGRPTAPPDDVRREHARAQSARMTRRPCPPDRIPSFRREVEREFLDRDQIGLAPASPLRRFAARPRLTAGPPYQDTMFAKQTDLDPKAALYRPKAFLVSATTSGGVLWASAIKPCSSSEEM